MKKQQPIFIDDKENEDWIRIMRRRKMSEVRKERDSNKKTDRSKKGTKKA